MEVLIFVILFVMVWLVYWECNYKPLRRARELARELKEELDYNSNQLAELKKKPSGSQASLVQFRNIIYRTATAHLLSRVFTLGMLKALMDIYAEFEVMNKTILDSQKSQDKKPPLFEEDRINRLQERILSFTERLNISLKHKGD